MFCQRTAFSKPLYWLHIRTRFNSRNFISLFLINTLYSRLHCRRDFSPSTYYSLDLSEVRYFLINIKMFTRRCISTFSACRPPQFLKLVIKNIEHHCKESNFLTIFEHRINSLLQNFQKHPERHYPSLFFPQPLQPLSYIAHNSWKYRLFTLFSSPSSAMQ